YGRALALGEKAGGASFTTSLSNLGHAHAALGRRDEARRYFERARAAAEASGDEGRLGTVLFNLGTIARDEGRLDEAWAYQQQSLAIRESLGGRIGIIESRTEIGSLAIRRDDPAAALAQAVLAVDLASESRLLNQLWKAQWLAAEAEVALGRADDALRRYGQAIETIETLRQLTAGGDRARLLYLPDRLGPYYRLARLHAAAGRNAEALAAVERARSRVLLDILADGAQAGRSLTPEQRARERALTQAVVSWSSQISAEAARPSPDTARLAALDAELARARLARDVFTEGLYDAQPGLRLARGREPIVEPGQLDRLVPEGTAIAEFVVEADQVWVYWIAGGAEGATITPRRLAVTPEELARLSTRFAGQVASRDLGFAPTARALYDALFGELDALMAPTRRLVVVPDGVIWRVPVQALRTPRGRFVIEERSVSYAPSVSALAALDARRRGRAGRQEFLVAMADPAPAGPRGRSPVDRVGGQAAPALPEARREVRALARLYGPSRSAVVVGRDATEPSLARAVGRASVLHIATHGVVDDQHPMYSHVLLATAPGSGSESDGRLEAWEVMDLPIDADLVVLSACETARGRWADGEGIVGLSWSFFAAGASAAVVSQWNVDSSSTTDLMIAFHEQRLKGHANAADALRAAARALLATPAWRHPFYWAGFGVVGAP
ncbi:MAG: CHAT domain-containing protein, partial [Vicinamibacterales bacterium]